MPDAPTAEHADIPLSGPRDLPPLVIDAVTAAGVTLIASPPLRLAVTPDEESPQFLTVEDRDLNLYAGAETRAELAAEVGRHVAFLWQEYALGDPAKLSPAARQLRDRLRRRVREM